MKNELAQELSGMLIIYMQVTLESDKNGNNREKQVTIARVRCTRKNAEQVFAKFKDLNPPGNFHAEFNFDLEFIH
jgi:cobalamin biosynthesis protein CbiG